MRATGWEGPPASSVRGSMLPNDSSGSKQAGASPAPGPPVPRGATLDTSPRDSHPLVPGLCMAKSPENSTLEEILGQYQRSLRERANRSIHQLQSALREGDGGVGEGAPDAPCGTGVESEDPGAAWQELQYSHAVNQLKALLRQQATKESEVSLSRRRNASPLRSSESEEANMPTVYNLVPIVNDQSQYIHHLEAEVKFCKEELSGMKNRVQVVVLENERLQQELKSQRQEEAMREQTLLDASGNLQNSWITTGDGSGMNEGAKRRFSQGNADAVKGPSAGEAEKWKLELEKLKLTYEEKGEILESQLKILRKDLAEYQKTCEDLKERLKHKESLLAANMSNRVGGLCLKCAQHEAVLSQTHSNVHVQTIERLTKERDDLMSALVSVRSSLTDVQQREAGAYEQVKQAMHMTEEANFEKTKALIQCEQLKNELERQTERLEKELVSQQEKRAFEKETMRKEITKEREDLGSKMLSLSQNIAQLEAQVEKVTREKISAINQLEEVQNQLASKEMDVTKEIEKLRSEVSESRQHLEQEQQKAALAREECLKLTELLSESERQLHLTRLEKDSIQQSFSNEAKAQALQAQQREQELTQKIQQMEAQHDRTENEQYSLLTSQNTFLIKLKEECCTLAKKLEQISTKSRSEITQLNQEKMYTYNKLEKLQRRNDELEEQCVQHGRLHEIMKERLKQLDKHSQATAQQLVQLLKKQNELLLERQSLAEEVGRLRSQVPVRPSAGLPSMRQSDC
ncbi:serologically defined colon cancer antigen 8 isoform X4 [Mustela putorius furo]|uniref:Serologically defined colon cancer antigen 8 isoform X4 n=1 Tax=Mustela putorius furo TaxID=9669 RepID=A0A8U0V7G4_MUSPF|nr:serologically defined colon cancer antigen 8 isoform X4 [Mustela putorius furo]